MANGTIRYGDWRDIKLPQNAAGGLKVVGLYAATRKPSGEFKNHNGRNFDGRQYECKTSPCGHTVTWPEAA